jgi:hypothetical protein
VTANDANLGHAYARNRAIGIRAAYAHLAQVPSTWTISDASVAGHAIRLYTLKGDSRISLVFLKLPDGNFDGNEWSNNNYQSLQKLLMGTIPQIDAIDGSNKFTKVSLQRTLLKIILNYRPHELRTQDTNEFILWDHSDHRAVASLVKGANILYTTPHVFIYYIDYMDIFLT